MWVEIDDFFALSDPATAKRVTHAAIALLDSLVDVDSDAHEMDGGVQLNAIIDPDLLMVDTGEPTAHAIY